MKDEKIEIKQGIKFHKIKTNKFKTNLFAIFLNTALSRENVTKDALITALLRRGTMELKSQDLISKELENMYGAGFDCGIEKSGDYHTFKFYLEVINDDFLPEKENLSEKALKLLISIVFNPFIENGSFKEEYVKQEKSNLKQIIEGKIDNKGNYALERCIEEMYKEKPYGLFKYGYIEDVEKITAKDLYEYYLKLIQECKIDIFASGDINDNYEEIVRKDENINKLKERNIEIKKEDKKEIINQAKEIIDNMDVTQGKLVMGLDLMLDKEDIGYAAMVYNTILGVGANSKMFRNVREKESLAYTCGTNYIKRKNLLLVRAGIEIENYEKAVKLIKKEIADMKDGNFTDEDIKNAKNLIYSTIYNIEEEQDTEISYYFGQEISDLNTSVEEYKEKIEKITREDIIEVANNMQYNTIYFLRN
ncbi:MAG: insulinase family protein [Clostridia bacterium]|nr:insulinase family protein [Clostridia bacterium]